MPMPHRKHTLYGVSMSFRALCITRRLSLSQNMDIPAAMLRRKSQFMVVKKQEPTYKTEPDETFSPGQIKVQMERVLGMYLNDVDYSGRECANLTMDLSNKIKATVKETAGPRYKLVCSLMIGEKKGQGIQASSRCLWSTASDNSVTATFENDTIYAVATLYAVYMDWCLKQITLSLDQNSIIYKALFLCRFEKQQSSLAVYHTHVELPLIPAKLLHKSETVSVYVNHFYCMEICDKLRSVLAMLTDIYRDVDEYWLTSSMV